MVLRVAQPACTTNDKLTMIAGSLTIFASGVFHEYRLTVRGIRQIVDKFAGCGVRSTMSVAAPFVWRCLSGSAITPFPHPANRTQQRDFWQRAKNLQTF